MSVVELDKIDGMGISQEDDKSLILLLCDHLDWDENDEGYDAAHLSILQDKINAYAEFVESKQYEKIYRFKSFNRFIIQICFLYDYPQVCVQFLEVAEKQLSPLNIVFDVRVDNQ